MKALAYGCYQSFICLYVSWWPREDCGDDRGSFVNGNVEFYSSGFEAGPLKGLCSEMMEANGFDFPTDPLKTVFDRRIDNEKFDYLITICDELTFENCSVLLQGITNLYADSVQLAHWSVPDFVSLSGSVAEKMDGAQNIKDLITEYVSNFLNEIGPYEIKR